MVARKKVTAKRTPRAKRTAARNKPRSTKKGAGAPSAAKRASDGASSLREHKPGWLSRVFGIETASLIACDASHHRNEWVRGETFSFLYRSRRGKYFQLTDPHRWSLVTTEDAEHLFARLPQKLVSRAEAFAAVAIEPVPRGQDDKEDDRLYKVVRNDRWDFAVWLDHKPLPAGWYHIGIAGTKLACLDYVEQNAVFGAPNPGLP